MGKQRGVTYLLRTIRRLAKVFYIRARTAIPPLTEVDQQDTDI
jgi:hypothetical protein